MAVSIKKATGSYYTDPAVATFLATWAIRRPGERVLEPSFGDGVFLSAAHSRFASLGGNGQIVGVDINQEAWESAKEFFPHFELVLNDFFKIPPGAFGLFDAVIGNPPFIRYHYFTGEARKRALSLAAAKGVMIPALASAWAPFIVQAVSHLATGGRLGMVAPYEVTYANYARPVVAYLAKSFGDVKCLTFDTPLFPALNEKTVLLLCSGFGRSTAQIAFHRYESLAAASVSLGEPDYSVHVEDWGAGSAKAGLLNLPVDIRRLYLDMTAHAKVSRLGELMDLTIGYVTGANDFFHLSRSEVERTGLAARDLRLAIRRSSDFGSVGLAIRSSDARELAASDSHWLFLPEGTLDPNSQRYTEDGERAGVHTRYKCRARKPWYLVPGVRTPEMMMSVFSTSAPRLVANEAGLVASNSVLVLTRGRPGVDRLALAASSLTSLAQLSAEIEGHTLGGGALKFEPAEARNWLLPYRPGLGPPAQPSREVLEDIDRLCRTQRYEAQDLADKVFLRDGLGLKPSDTDALRDGIATLRALRHHRRV
ncbi:MAG: Eco57I restriction-modification methylase domain-containing protein [Bacillota bacterium]